MASLADPQLMADIKTVRAESVATKQDELRRVYGENTSADVLAAVAAVTAHSATGRDCERRPGQRQ